MDISHIKNTCNNEECEDCRAEDAQSDKVYDQCRDNGDDFADLRELFGE